MTLAVVYSRASSGITAPLVTVEIHISPGLPSLSIVGLPEAAVKESKDRVRSALMTTAFYFPMQRVTVNLAPADLPKEGGRFDLPIALGILGATGQIPLEKLAHYEFTGELALTGELRAVRSVLPIVLGTGQTSRTLIVPAANANEAALVKQATVLQAGHLLEVCAHLRGDHTLPACERVADAYEIPTYLDLSDVKGQQHPKRALEIAAAGRHNLLMVGPPGTGKSMLASRLPSILPPLSDSQALEVAAIGSISTSGFDHRKWQELPFRSPHHSSSSVALVGGGRPPRPGEISLAHHGVLFLDELPEFDRHVLESLREPLESGSITISRAAFQTVFPAQFQLITAMNPCPCGFAGSTRHACRCSPEQVQRYRSKLSGPFLDRIDMQVEVPSVPLELLSAEVVDSPESSQDIRERVLAAYNRQLARQGKSNRELSVRELQDHAPLAQAARVLLQKVMSQYNLSARVYHRIVKVAKTIADLADQDTITTEHVSEVLTYRCMDRI